MKNLLLILLVLLIGCKSAPKEKTEKPLTIDEIVRNSTEEYLKDKLNDPDSYEFVKLVLLDSVLYKDNVEYRRDRFNDDPEVLAKIDSLESAMGDKVNEVASYTFVFSFRATNAMGAKVLEEYYLQTGESPNYEVLNLAEDMDQLYLNPGDFPGYIDMIKKHKGYD